MKKSRVIIFGLLAMWFIGIVVVYLAGSNFQVLNPKGTIAESERDLIIFASLLSLIIVLPVFFMTFYIAWKYRATNTKAKYKPDWDGNRLIETVWWLIPLVLISVLSVITWRTTHELDPFRPLETTKKPVTVQVVAMQWKWLFIYPEQNIASLNFVQFPEDRPVNFQITAEGPMNSFWIPQLGGQIYAMSGMSTKLHLMASEPGDYNGLSANISGEGFADMKFVARASSEDEFSRWVAEAKRSGVPLDQSRYYKLLEPSHIDGTKLYASTESGLYNKMVMKYMLPAEDPAGTQPTNDHESQHENH